jgi:hypothetical protein
MSRLGWVVENGGEHIIELIRNDVLDGVNLKIEGRVRNFPYTLYIK